MGIVFSNANQPGSAGPPFVPSSADNGLSIDPITGHIVLGQSLGAVGDPSQFLDAREIVMAGHPFTMRNAGNTQFRLNPGLGIYQIGDVDSAAFGTRLNINDPAQIIRLERAAELMLFLAPQVYSLGNVNDTLLGSKISIDDANESLVFRSLARGRMMDLAGFNQLYRIGDIDSLGNGNALFIDDSNRSILLGDANFLGNGMNLDINNTQPRMQVYDSSNAYFDIAPAIGQFAFGNIFPANDLFLYINTNAQQRASIGRTGEPPAVHYLDIDVTNGLYQLGDIDITSNGMVVGAIDVASIAFMGNQAATNRITIDAGGGQGSVLAPNGWAITSTDGILQHHTNALTNGAGVSAGTLLNAPAAGNPTKWIPIDDAGVTRFIPAW